MLQLTHALVKFSTISSPLKRGLRDTVTPVVSRIPGIQRRTVRRMSHHHVAYRASSLTRSDRRLRGPRPGERAPDIDVVGRGTTRQLHRALRGDRHVLVVPRDHALGTSAREALLPYEDDLEVVYGQLDAIKRIGAPPPGTVLLVRSDGYVAARGTTERLPRVLDYLNQVYDRR